MKYYAFVGFYLELIQSSLPTFVRQWAIETPYLLEKYNPAEAIKIRHEVLNNVCEEYLDVLNPEAITFTKLNANFSSTFCMPPLFVGKSTPKSPTTC